MRVGKEIARPVGGWPAWRGWKKAAALTACAMLLTGATIPRHYPRSYGAIIDAAKREAVVVIASTTDQHEITGVLAAFRQAYPFVRIVYQERSSRDLYTEIVSATRRRAATPDLVWSSAMDLQIKLVNDGYVQAYASPEKPYLPPWAIWKNEAYGVTAEPFVFVYNSRLVQPVDVPRTHPEFTRLLRAKAQQYRGRIAAFDPVRSGAGYLSFTQDQEASRDIWELVAAMGATGVKLHDSSRAMIAAVASGQQALGYNAIGSYAFEAAARNPAVKVSIPSDYALVMSRIVVIPNEARHPNAAKLLLDFLLSRRGQFELAKVYMGPVRNDVPAHPNTKPTSTAARPVRIGPTLMTNLDQIKRRRFLSRWQQALAGK
jgi:iron(III) transport system substrate-binding protein